MANQTHQSGNQSSGKQGGSNQGIGNQDGSGCERGFVAMDPQEQRAIAAKNGRAAHERGNAHEFTSEEAREAGRKGGEASGGSNRSGSEGGSGRSN